MEYGWVELTYGTNANLLRDFSLLINIDLVELNLVVRVRMLFKDR